jgi:aminopeptidase N
MMWGSLWDSVREGELDPREYVELAIRVLSSNFSLPGSNKKPAKAGTQNLPEDETTTAMILNRVSHAMTYYLSDAERVSSPRVSKGPSEPARKVEPSLTVGLRTSADLQSRLEAMLIAGMRGSPTLGQRITYYRAFLNIVSTENGRNVLKTMLQASEPGAVATGAVGRPADAVRASSPRSDALPLKTKDRFDIVTRLAILGDPEAPRLLENLEKTETSDDAKRYAYAAHSAFATKENRERFWIDFVNNKTISESWIEAAIGPFNSPRHDDLSLPYLTRALGELPNLKRTRKIFFVNNWLGAFIGGQKSQAALDIVNKFLADNPNLDRDLRLKILENMDTIERSVKIRNIFSK